MVASDQRPVASEDRNLHPARNRFQRRVSKGAAEGSEKTGGIVALERQPGQCVVNSDGALSRKELLFSCS